MGGGESSLVGGKKYTSWSAGRVLGLLLVNVLLVVFLLELVLQALALGNRYLHRLSGNIFGARDSVKVLCLGDSNTYGLYLADRSQAWCMQLEREWNALHASHPPKMEAINLGWPGTISARIASQIETMMLQFQPDYVFLMIGVNDYWNSWLEVDQPRGLQKAISWVRQHSRIYRVYRLLRANLHAYQSVSALQDNAPEFDFEEIVRLPLPEAEKYMQYFLYRALGPDVVFRQQNGQIVALFRGKTVSLTEWVGRAKSGIPEEDQSRVISELLAMLDALDAVYMHGTRVGAAGQTYVLGNYRYPGIAGDGDRSLAENLPAIQAVVHRYGGRLLLVEYPSSEGMYGWANARGRWVAEQYGILRVATQAELVRHCSEPGCRDYLYEDQHPRQEGHRWVAERVLDFLKCDMDIDSPP